MEADSSCSGQSGCSTGVCVLRRQAERDSSAEELRIVREEAARWESRVNELLLKYGSVDLAEHNRVADALKVPRRL
jgi:hypothetical protein